MKLRNTASGIMPRKGGNDDGLAQFRKDLEPVFTALKLSLAAIILAGCVDGGAKDLPIVGRTDDNAVIDNTPSSPRDELGVATLNLLDEAVALTAEGEVVTDPSTIMATESIGSDAATALMEARTTGELSLEEVEYGTVRTNKEGHNNNCGKVIATVDRTPSTGPIDDLFDIANGGNSREEIGITACVAVDGLQQTVHSLVFRATSDGSVYFEVKLDKDTDRPTDLVGNFDVATGGCTVTTARFGTKETVTPSRPACKDAVEHIGRSVGANFGN